MIFDSHIRDAKGTKKTINNDHDDNDDHVSDDSGDIYNIMMAKATIMIAIPTTRTRMMIVGKSNNILETSNNILEKANNIFFLFWPPP